VTVKQRTSQMARWAGDFGREYTDRNPHTVRELDELYQGRFGSTRTAMNTEFLASLDRNIRILEVGANVGVQLLALQELGFENLYGVELQRYAVEEAKKLTTGIDLIQASAFDLPFNDERFDLVYTSGVLIHISPADISRALSEVYRCSRRYIWGFEYFAEVHTEIPYRGSNDLMWKADFAALYSQQFPDSSVVLEVRYAYLGEKNVDQMFLIEKA